jgi:ATP/maltotriose-dependent transcriptional regulator MalT
MARGYSNKLIARRLGISLATVKTHVHHLFRKLRVSSRALAVKRAEALALI